MMRCPASANSPRSRTGCRWKYPGNCRSASTVVSRRDPGCANAEHANRRMTTAHRTALFYFSHSGPRDDHGKCEEEERAEDVTERILAVQERHGIPNRLERSNVA